jgi:hypothetical protein
MPTIPAAARATRPVAPRATDFAVVAGAWALAVLAAAVFPLRGPQLAHGALFVHLVSMAVGFGAVVMVDVYGLLWLFGARTLSEVVALAAAAHGVISLGVGGLLASGIALRPDLSSPLARLKLLLVLVLMLNGVAAQRTLQALKRSLPTDLRGASIPWMAFQRVLFAALVSQSTWWGAIAIGFVTNAGRHAAKS